MDRIKINDFWYVKEDKPTKLDLTEKDVTFSKSCVYETGDYCWEASLISKDNGKEFYPDLEIEFTGRLNVEGKVLKNHPDFNCLCDNYANHSSQFPYSIKS